MNPIKQKGLKMRKCIIVGAGEFSGLRPEFTAEYIIAADGGFDKLAGCAITPDLMVGDFDSLEGCDIASHTQVIRFPAEKDASDLELSVEQAVDRGFDCFYIYGALGGRLDHTLASIAVLVGISKKAMTGWLIGENEVVTAVTDGKVVLKARESGSISVFPAGETARGVSLKGLKYPLNNATLTHTSTHGLSNEFIGEEAVIEVREGTLVVVIT